MDNLSVKQALLALRDALIRFQRSPAFPSLSSKPARQLRDALFRAMDAFKIHGGSSLQRGVLTDVSGIFLCDPSRITPKKISRLIEKSEKILDQGKAMPLPEANSGGCSGPVRRMASRLASAATEKVVAVDVFFATDRKASGKSDPDKIFGGARSDHTGAVALSYGRCTVTIPPGHRQGEVESPSFWRLEFRSNPKKHVVLQDVLIQSADDFFRTIQERTADPAQADAFIFVHGYNVSFADAARRTGQMAYDLGFRGIPVFYSWPSAASAKDYVRDGNAVEWSEPHLTLFLKDFMARSQVQNIHLIAHSMGNRALTSAVVNLFQNDPAARERIREIILTAPDVDARVFLENIAPQMTMNRHAPVTLYVSSRDMALETSKLINGGTRLGDSHPAPVVCGGVETIDATVVDTSLMGHSYFAGTRSVLGDIFNLFKGQRAADRFGLRRASDPRGQTYWEFVP